MRERTLEAAQLHCLCTRYDLSRDSRLARAIVSTINAALDREEARRGVQRVRTGELLVRTKHGPLTIALRTPELLERALRGERFESIRADILQSAETQYRSLFPKSDRGTLQRFLRSLYPNRMPSKPGDGPHPALGTRRERPYGSLLSGAKPISNLDLERAEARNHRGPPRPAHDPDTIAQLIHYLDTQAGIPPAIQEALVFELISLRARYHPMINTLATGQMPLASMDVTAGRNLWKSHHTRPLNPIIITLLHGNEARILRHHPPTDGNHYLHFHAKRMARVLQEAYVQNGLLSYTELQWAFMLSHATVSRALHAYQQQHKVILPCPGTVLDMGRMLTHKDIIIRLHLQGHSTLEIARQTHHHPKSVDAYLQDFDATLILHLYRIPTRIAASILRKGVSLIEEHLVIINSYLKDPEEMRNHLINRGINIPPLVPHNG
jgi:hypothetical protein